MELYKISFIFSGPIFLVYIMQDFSHIALIWWFYLINLSLFLTYKFGFQLNVLVLRYGGGEEVMIRGGEQE